eukprot:TRINITY_DN28903_c0_g1_i1.p2 TRINITY_DN28903_c0_g1~~TRINITY_DN28903_c0_g1_i1.p2  ORF type:complete len:164 (+),score=27.65 TRINITY_DN28903_c0_g1_i1:36-527(+)
MTHYTDTDGYDVEEQDIAIEVKDFEGVDIDLAGEEFQLVGIEEPTPILRIGDKVFEGTWGEYCVCGVIYSSEIQHQTSVTKKLVFNRVLPIAKDGNNKPLPESGIDTAPILGKMHKYKNNEVIKDNDTHMQSVLEAAPGDAEKLDVPVYRSEPTDDNRNLSTE